jgi:hypothetical protein
MHHCEVERIKMTAIPLLMFFDCYLHDLRFDEQGFVILRKFYFCNCEIDQIIYLN